MSFRSPRLFDHYLLEQSRKDCSSSRLKQRGGPYLESHISLHIPIHTDTYNIDQPKICTLYTLRTIFQTCIDRHNPTSLIDKWLAKNTVSYRLGADPSCLDLWSDFLSYSHKHPDLTYELPILPPDVAFYFVRCPLHGDIHIQICWPSVTSRRRLKFVNKLFPFSSDSDKAHTILDLASYLYHIHKPEARNLVNKTSFFALLCCGVT